MIERAADDLLLLLTPVETPDMPLPSQSDVLAVLMPYVEAHLPEVTRFVQRNKQQATGAQFGFQTAVEGLMEPAAAHLLLSLRVLVWAAERTGMTHAQVIAGVLAQTDVPDDEKG